MSLADFARKNGVEVGADGLVPREQLIAALAIAQQEIEARLRAEGVSEAGLVSSREGYNELITAINYADHIAGGRGKISDLDFDMASRDLAARAAEQQAEKDELVAAAKKAGLPDPEKNISVTVEDPFLYKLLIDGNQQQIWDAVKGDGAGAKTPTEPDGKPFGQGVDDGGLHTGYNTILARTDIAANIRAADINGDGQATPDELKQHAAANPNAWLGTSPDFPDKLANSLGGKSIPIANADQIANDFNARISGLGAINGWISSGKVEDGIINSINGVAVTPPSNGKTTHAPDQSSCLTNNTAAPASTEPKATEPVPSKPASGASNSEAPAPRGYEGISLGGVSASCLSSLSPDMPDGRADLSAPSLQSGKVSHSITAIS